MANKPEKSFNIPLNGQVIKSNDPAAIGNNFQVLENMAYTDTHPKAVSGMEKINSATITTIRNMFHFKKAQPVESHLLVNAEGVVWENKAAIPSQGDFEATELHTDASGADIGRFSNAPDGAMIYCNGKETMQWKGDESRVAAFKIIAEDESFKYDFTEQVNNTFDDPLNTAIMRSVTETIDSYTKTLLHLDNNVTDSSASAHTVTNNNVTFSTSIKKFGTHSAYFNGTNARLSIPDHADFNFSGGVWTLEWVVYIPSSSTGTKTLYSQKTAGANTNIIISMMKVAGNNYVVDLLINSSGTTTVGLFTSDFITPDVFHHIEVSENGDNYYIFVDGILAASTTDTSRPSNYDQPVYIGYVQQTTVYGGACYIDEFRVSNGVCRHTSNFIPRAVAYGDLKNCTVYVGSLVDLEAVKFYMKTPNTSAYAKVTEGYYWDGDSWMSMTLTDGTVSSAKTLAQTGSISFTSTEGLAELKIIDSTLIKWYKFVFYSLDDTTEVSHVTVKAPFQALEDIWDGQLRKCMSFKIYKGGKFIDYTVNVASDTYSSTDGATYAKLDSVETSTGYLLVGLDERASGLYFGLAEDYVNTTADTVLTLNYWNGSAFTPVSADDGTVNAGISIGKGGFITWQPPAASSEFRKSYDGGSELFYYRLDYSATLSTGIRLAFVGGIPAPKQIGAYSFSFMDHNRAFLCCNNAERKNEIVALKAETHCVANGEDSATIYFGDEAPITAGGSLYAQLGSNLYDIKVICKASEVWIMTGSSPENYEKKRIFNTDGCVAPLTFDTSIVNVAGSYRPVAIWQGSEAIYLFDGSTVVPITEDISNFFDKTQTLKINPSMIARSFGKIDPTKNRYHFLFATGSSSVLNNEWVYDLKRNRWFEIKRDVKYLQSMAKVADTYGNQYMYGSIDTGYVERLEYGNSWDGEDIVCRGRTADIMLSPNMETTITYLQLKAVAKNNTARAMKITLYGDTEESGKSYTMSMNKVGHRLTSEVLGVNFGEKVYHSIEWETITNNEITGCELVGINGVFKEDREHRR
jgi:hypothetical protein